jgi:tRNA (guanine-N7-)-methyltransferase
LGKNKLKRWTEIDSYRHVFQPDFKEVFKKDFFLKGRWNDHFFKNPNPIILELGCGRGEYTTGLARMYPDRNFIGVDIKGARLWKGAYDAEHENLSNVAFIRSEIEVITSFFAHNEVAEIWITFPDPQLKQKRIKKRLTAPLFLNAYQTFLQADGVIHLKTDSQELYRFTNDLIKYNSLEIIASINDIYSQPDIAEPLNIRTHYEQIYIDRGLKITYTSFRLAPNRKVKAKIDADEKS